MHVHVLPEHRSYSLFWMVLGVILAPTAVIAGLFELFYRVH
jgi:Mg2+ and Co2+ transporter CorA